jgi:hypothetical protein
VVEEPCIITCKVNSLVLHLGQYCTITGWTKSTPEFHESVMHYYKIETCIISILSCLFQSDILFSVLALLERVICWLSYYVFFKLHSAQCPACHHIISFHPLRKFCIGFAREGHLLIIIPCFFFFFKLHSAQCPACHHIISFHPLRMFCVHKPSLRSPRLSVYFTSWLNWPKDGGDMFFWSVGWLSADYTALYTRR